MGVVLRFLAFLLLISTVGSAQTLTLNDASVVQSNLRKIGLNLIGPTGYDSGETMSSLSQGNPGFEPLIDQQIWIIQATGTTTSFTEPDVYDTVVANYWAGATFTVTNSQSGGTTGCTGTVSANTAGSYPTAPVFTVSACSGSFANGDTVIVKKVFTPTSESWWEAGQGGIGASISGGATLTSDTTDLCATCGSQALEVNATSGTAQLVNYWDSAAANTDIFRLINQAYTWSFWAKNVSGTPTVSVSLARQSSGGVSCSSTPVLTSSWAQYTMSCSGVETASGTGQAAIKNTITVTGGAVYLDNLEFGPTTQTNPTVFADAVVNTLQTYYNASASGPQGVLRYWAAQNGMTLDNWILPRDQRMPTVAGAAQYYVSPAGAGTLQYGLYDYLALCAYIHAEPYIEVPVTFTTSDATNLIEFLASPSTTAYGTKRANLGQTAPFTGVFSVIHLALCDECWNTEFSGQNLPGRSGSPDSGQYYDYSVRANQIYTAMRGDSYYSSGSFDLIQNAQTGSSYGMSAAVPRVHPDTIEIEGYTGGVINNPADAAAWGFLFVDPYQKVFNSSDPSNTYQSLAYYQGLNSCGASSSTACKVSVYEWGQGTLSGTMTQVQQDPVNAGSGEGVVMALQPLLWLATDGLKLQNFFALSGYQLSAQSNGNIPKVWGNVVDMGGATNNVRPTFLGVQIDNKSMIGNMFSCPITSGATYNYAGSTQNGYGGTSPALSNVPYVYAFCFENGTNRSIVLINTDLASTHTLTLAGTNLPTGTITKRQYAPSGLDLLNEANTGTNTQTTAAAVSLTSASVAAPTSVTLPVYSVTAYDWTVSSSSALCSISGTVKFSGTVVLTCP